MKGLEARQHFFRIFLFIEPHLLLCVFDGGHESAVARPICGNYLVILEEVVVGKDEIEDLLRLSPGELVHTVIISIFEHLFIIGSANSGNYSAFCSRRELVTPLWGFRRHLGYFLGKYRILQGGRRRKEES